ncbi:hypothetical protein LLG95_11525 [bacterium]|nr:hypothetical protein [bacterium]
MFKKIFSRLAGKTPSPRKALQEASLNPDNLKWLEPEENDYGVRILDCREVTTKLISTTTDKTIALKFTSSGQYGGAEYIGEEPKNPQPVPGELKYPYASEAPADGPIYLAQEMEDKWNIFLQEGFLYFTRSWTGDLMIKAAARFEDGFFHVSSIRADPRIIEGDPIYALCVVDYLIKIFPYRVMVPAPIPTHITDRSKIALWLFSTYGRCAHYGTYADTLELGNGNK